ncbi:transposase [Cytobacillus sp. FJAT-54145]|uniref:Transposase n=1 Tax=Cytobacillus spartinae TaxID=3299023 RepID=A0ABW6K9H4_9BACI
MPRRARKKSSNGMYHIMLRGINKQSIFEDDEDKHKFLSILKKFKDISRFELYCYCLMDNHVHLLMKESEESISITIKRISSSYVYWYNMKYERCGHLFQERYRSESVEDISYFLKVLRYIHQNPIKAGLANSVLESKWTSINEYFEKDTFVDIDLGLSLFSQYQNTAIQLFKEYMVKSNNDQCLDDKLKERMSDSEVREHMHKIGISNISVLQQLDKDKRDVALARLKELEGVSLRQLSRITGISKSVIHRALQ